MTDQSSRSSPAQMQGALWRSLAASTERRHMCSVASYIPIITGGKNTVGERNALPSTHRQQKLHCPMLSDKNAIQLPTKHFLFWEIWRTLNSQINHSIKYLTTESSKKACDRQLHWYYLGHVIRWFWQLRWHHKLNISSRRSRLCFVNDLQVDRKRIKRISASSGQLEPDNPTNTHTQHTPTSEQETKVSPKISPQTIHYFTKLKSKQQQKDPRIFSPLYFLGWH